MKTNHYRLPTKHLALLKKELAGTFARVVEETARAAPVTVYDTFDSMDNAAGYQRLAVQKAPGK